MGKSKSGLEIYGFAFAVVTLVTVSMLKCQKCPSLLFSSAQRFTVASGFARCLSRPVPWPARKGPSSPRTPICLETSCVVAGLLQN